MQWSILKHRKQNIFRDHYNFATSSREKKVVQNNFSLLFKGKTMSSGFRYVNDLQITVSLGQAFQGVIMHLYDIAVWLTSSVQFTRASLSVKEQ